MADKSPYHYKIYRFETDGKRSKVWYEDTEYGIKETLKAVADMLDSVSFEVSRVTIKRVN